MGQSACGRSTRPREAGTVVLVLPYRGDVQPLGRLIRERRRQLGLSQADVAEAVGVFDRPTVTRQEVARWERGKRIPRGRTRKALALALDLSVRLLDLAAAVERARRSVDSARGGTEFSTRPGLATQASAVQAIRVALLDHGGSSFSLVSDETDERPPDPSDLRGELADVMAAYQASRYGDMLVRLPEVLSGSHLAVGGSNGDRWRDAQRILALASQAAAMVLTKLGELDLAWTAADRGLLAAQRSGDEAVLGSLCRSVVHTLQSHGRAQAATRLADKTADNLCRQVTPASQRAASVYGTLLLAAAMASARAGDRPTTHDYLNEADIYAHQVGRDANHLWTAFGPTNVGIHRVATSVALGDMGEAHSRTVGIDATRLPLERRVRYAFDLARMRIECREFDSAVDEMLAAERLAPEQVHHHVISRQIVADLCCTSKGERSAGLAQLAQRVQEADYMALGSIG